MLYGISKYNLLCNTITSFSRTWTYSYIYNSEYDNSDSVFDSNRGITATAISPPYTSSTSTSTKPYQNRYYNEYHEGLVELAKGFLNSLLNQLVDKTMVAAVKGQ